MKHALKELLITTPIVMIGMTLFVLAMTLITMPKAHGCNVKQLPFGSNIQTLSERYRVIDDEVAIKGYAEVPISAESFCASYPEGVMAAITLVDNKMVKFTLIHEGKGIFKQSLEQQLGEMSRESTREEKLSFEYNWDNQKEFVAHYSVRPALEGVREYIAISSRSEGEAMARLHLELEKE